jgi:hypothetical protein
VVGASGELFPRSLKGSSSHGILARAGSRGRPPSDGLLPPSPPTEQATACQDQARQSSAGDGTWDGHAGERKARVKWSLVGDVSADPLPVGHQVKAEERRMTADKWSSSGADRHGLFGP